MKLLVTILTLGTLGGLLANADTLRLTNGATLEGTYLGGNTREVRFLGPDGVAKNYPITSIRTIEFSPAPALAAAPPPPAPAPAPVRPSAVSRWPASRPPGITLPSGTVISVRMIDPIDAKTTAIGERFRASVDDPVVFGNRTVIPRGADCTVQVMKAETGGKIKGSDQLALKLYDVTVNGKVYDVASDYAQMKTRGEGRNTARNAGIMAGIGAAIGAIAGGGKGAAIGAGAGAAAGAAGSMIKGPHLVVPSETRLTFELRAPLPLD